MSEGGAGWHGAQRISFESIQTLFTQRTHLLQHSSHANTNNIHIVLYLLIALTSSLHHSLWARCQKPQWVLRHDSNKQPHWVNQDLDLSPCSLELRRMNHSRRWQQRDNFLWFKGLNFMPIIFWCSDFECYSVDGSSISKDITTAVWMTHWDSLSKSMALEGCVCVCVCVRERGVSEERQESSTANIECF